MAKIDYQKNSLPDIEMYAGNTDAWEFDLYDTNMRNINYDDVTAYTFKLIIKDYGYIHRSNGPTYVTIIKNGALYQTPDGLGAYVIFRLDQNDTNDKYGKFTYQIEASNTGAYYSAQGNLYITKNINQ